MSFDECLKEVGPLLGLQWRLFQRRGIKRKIERRALELGLAHLGDYLLKVRNDPEEKDRLSQILTVTISRFFRDREVFDVLEGSVLPSIVQQKEKGEVRVWSIGCASGEEPYSLSLLWKEKFEKEYPTTRLSIVATDINETLLRRAKEGRYRKSSLREIPDQILKKYFRVENGYYVIDQVIRDSVDFRRQNVLEGEVFSDMDIIFCRNLAFTYFSKESQVEVLKKIASSLNEKGYLVIGKDESLPLVYPTLFVPISSAHKIYQKFDPHLKSSED